MLLTKANASVGLLLERQMQRSTKTHSSTQWKFPFIVYANTREELIELEQVIIFIDL